MGSTKKIPVSYNHHNIAYQLALTQYILGRPEEYQAKLDEMLDNFEKNYKEDRLETYWPVQGSAMMAWRKDKLEEAEKYFKRSLEILKSHYETPDHISHANPLQGLGLVYLSMGDYQEAADILEKTLDIRRRFYKSGVDYRLGSPMYDLGLAYELLGNYTKALKTIKNSYEILHKHFKDRIIPALQIDLNIVSIWPTISTKNQSQAIEYFKEALEFAKKTYGKNHYLVPRYHYLIGQACEMNGKEKQAVIQYQKALTAANMVLNTIKNPESRKKYQRNIDILKNKLED